jgi:hypothetical protein
VCFLKRNAAFAPISFDVLKMITLQIELEMNLLDKNVNELEFQLCNVVEIHLNSHLQMMNELKMASRETIPLSHECSPLLGVFFCVKNNNTKERLL